MLRLYGERVFGVNGAALWDDAAVGSLRLRVSVCLVEAGRLLLVEHRKLGRSYWLLPGGGVEAGETMEVAARRELREETGFEVEVGRLLIVCEAVEPAAPRSRHLVNLVFAGRITGGELVPGRDRRLVDAAWHPLDGVAGLAMHPPIGDAVLACCAEGFEGPVRVLGNVWRSSPEG